MAKIRNVRSFFPHHNYRPSKKPDYDLKLNEKEKEKTGNPKKNK